MRRATYSPFVLGLIVLTCASAVPAQIIEFDSGGLHYQTLTKSGITVMFAHLPAHVREYATMQIAVSNGSSQAVTIRPDDFEWDMGAGNSLRPVPARNVVAELLQKAGRGDVVKLVSAYETGLYGVTQLRTTTGYESRRRAAMAEVQSTRIKAAAAASAIAFVNIKLAAGESTDGAIFINTEGKPLPAGILRIRAGGQLFEFAQSDPPLTK